MASTLSYFKKFPTVTPPRLEFGKNSLGDWLLGCSARCQGWRSRGRKSSARPSASLAPDRRTTDDRRTSTSGGKDAPCTLYRNYAFTEQRATLPPSFITLSLFPSLMRGG
eukprot:scaffold24515_cov112-Isochrysis_galbana.AAC.7